MTNNANKNHHDVKETTEEKKSFVELFFLFLTNESYIYIGFASDFLNIGDPHGFTLSCFFGTVSFKIKFQLPYASSCLTNLYLQPDHSIHKHPKAHWLSPEHPNAAYITIKACSVC